MKPAFRTSLALIAVLSLILLALLSAASAQAAITATPAPTPTPLPKGTLKLRCQLNNLLPSDDVACAVQVDGKSMGVLASGAWKRVRLAPGEHSVQISLTGESATLWTPPPIQSVTIRSGKTKSLTVMVAARLHEAPLSNIGPHLLEIYRQGQTLGLDPHAFSKIGDSVTVAPGYLVPFYFGEYKLGRYTHLQKTIEYFAVNESFGRTGTSAWHGANAASVFDPIWSNKNVCGETETPLACEVRVQRPAVALIFLRAWDGHGEAGSAYDTNMRAIVQYLLDQGVIPVLSTVPTPYHDPQYFDPMNVTLRQIASDFNIPLWDFHNSLENMPNRGLVDDLHLTGPEDGQTATLSDEYISQYGEVVHNLEALEVLTAILNEAILK